MEFRVKGVGFQEQEYGVTEIELARYHLLAWTKLP